MNQYGREESDLLGLRCIHILIQEDYRHCRATQLAAYARSAVFPAVLAKYPNRMS